MGIESDQLVFDYLSRVGDLAHGTAMTASERAQLVGGLRSEIDRKRAADGGADSKSAVKKILRQLGKPEDVVAAHSSGHRPTRTPRRTPEPDRREPGGSGSGGSEPGGHEPGAASFVPGPRDGAGPSLRKPAPAPEPAPEPAPAPGPEAERDPEPAPAPGPQPGATAGGGFNSAGGASPPHLAGMDELGPEESDPNWWRLDRSPYAEAGGGSSFGDAMPGFVGGIELPEVLKPPKRDAEDGAEAEDEADESVDAEGDATAEAEEPAPTGLRGRIPRPRLGGRAPDGVVAGPRVGGAVELLAAALLLAGAVLGSLVPLGLGWLAAWWSPRLTRTEAKWAAAGMPGLVAAGTAVWLWGRLDGRWGDPIGAGGEALRQALTDAMPVLLRIAAVASALYLVWRARRPAA